MKEEYDILIEKYRPKKLENIIGQDEILNRLRGYVKSKNMAHLLFGGPAGVGKTTAAIALAKELYGNQWKLNFEEINASDDRGIDVIRNKIKKYAAVAPIGDIPFKIIFLDEADSLTPDAQNALKRTMEKFTSSCRFILTANYSSKIIEPLQSRCAVYRFKRIDAKDLIVRCKYVADAENIKIESEALEAIAYIANGDCRKAIGLIDSSNLSTENNIITVEDIYQASSYTKPEIIIDILKKSLKEEFFVASDIIIDLTMDGISSDDIIKQLVDQTMNLSLPHDKIRIELIDIIGETDWRISMGANELISFRHMIAKMCKLGSVI